MLGFLYNRPAPNDPNYDRWYAVAFGLAYKTAELVTDVAAIYLAKQCHDAGSNCDKEASDKFIGSVENVGIRIQLALLACGSVHLFSMIKATLTVPEQQNNRNRVRVH